MKKQIVIGLYNQIPSFSCKPGCTDCCGPVPFAKKELDAIPKNKRSGFRPAVEIADSASCKFVCNGGCGIYEQRPFICRLFGATDDPRLRCPHGAGPAQPLTSKKADELTRSYMKTLGKGIIP